MKKWLSLAFMFLAALALGPAAYAVDTPIVPSTFGIDVEGSVTAVIAIIGTIVAACIVIPIGYGLMRRLTKMVAR